MKNWWDNFYNLQTADLYLKRDEVMSEKLTDFLIKQLNLSDADILFDQCCGIGTVGLPLAIKGVEIIGVDISKPFIVEAKRLSQNLNNTTFFCDDAFKFLPSKKCNAAINWYGSFGYANEDKQNIKMFEKAYESLLPGGKFAVDFMNTYGVLSHFKKEMVKEKGNFKIVRNCTLDFTNGRIEQDWNYYEGNKYIETKHSSVKLYLPHQIKTMMENCGFANIEIFGDINGNKLTENSPRCILIGKKI